MAMSVDDLRLAHGDLSRQIIGAFYEVYNEVGYGFPEAMYGEAMVFALSDRGLLFDRERRLVVRYKGRVIGDFRSDFLVDGKIIVELKVADKIVAAHESQVLNYLRASTLGVGLILNFGEKAGVRRVIWTGRRLASDVP
jgi:GxxExxY protein